MMVERETFNWEDPDTLVLREQRAIAVFVNNNNEIVVRQRVDYDFDVYVVFAPEHAQAIAAAILDWAAAVGASTRKDPTAAERQRRRRQRRTVTPHVTPSVTADVTLFDRDSDPTEKARE